MSLVLAPVYAAPGQCFDQYGLLLNGGRLYTYIANTTTPATTWANSAGSIPNSNPIVLDSSGRIQTQIWIQADTGYKFVLKTSSDVVVLTTDNIIVPSVGGTPISEPDTQIVYGTGGGVTSSSDLTWDDTAKVLSLSNSEDGGTAVTLEMKSTGGPGNFTIRGCAPTGAATGGNLFLRGGVPTNGAGGSVSIVASNAVGAGAGGDVALQAGDGQPNGPGNYGGNIVIRAGGAGAFSRGGDVLIQSGTGTAMSSVAGAVRIEVQPSQVAVSPNDAYFSISTATHIIPLTERLRIRGDGTWLINGSAGTSGYVLTSNGSGSPTWQPVGGGTGVVTSVYGRTGAVVAVDGDYSLTQLSDVTISSPTSGQVLRFNGTQWVNDNDFVGTVTAVNGTSGRITSTGGTTPTIDLATTSVTPGTYTLSNITVDAYGRITAASNGSAGSGTVTSVNVAGSVGRITTSGGPITSSGSITVDLATTSVTPGTYSLSTITVDAYGRITSASNGSAGSGTVTSVAATAGSGISVSGSPITTSGTLTITNTGVLSFNTRTGAVTLTSSDVTTALGYTPVNKAGDTVTGSLVVNGNITANANNTTGGGIILSDDGDIVDMNDSFCAMRFTGGVRIYSGNKSGSPVITLASSGDITATGNVTAYSDLRLKTNIKPIENALDKVCALTGVTYNRKDNGEDGIGLIAQQVLEVIPQAVKNNDEYLSLAYGNLVGVLVEAIKELTARVKQLENK